jgi:hypothetical protein
MYAINLRKNITLNEKRKEMEEKCINISGIYSNLERDKLINGILDMKDTLNWNDVCDINIKKYETPRLNIKLDLRKTPFAEYDIDTNTLHIGTDSENDDTVKEAIKNNTKLKINGKIGEAWLQAFDTYWGRQIDEENQYNTLLNKANSVKNIEDGTYDFSKMTSMFYYYSQYHSKGVRSKETMYKANEGKYTKSLIPLRFNILGTTDYIDIICKDTMSDYSRTVTVTKKKFESLQNQYKDKKVIQSDNWSDRKYTPLQMQNDIKIWEKRICDRDSKFGVVRNEIFKEKVKEYTKDNTNSLIDFDHIRSNLINDSLFLLELKNPYVSNVQNIDRDKISSKEMEVKIKKIKENVRKVFSNI